MEQINSEALTNIEAMPYARRVNRDRATGRSVQEAMSTRQVPDQLQADVLAILKAVEAGWFAIPEGRNQSYSKAQYESLHKLTTKAPWLHDVQAEAMTFEIARLAFKPKAGISFGVDPMPDFAAEATAAQRRLSRLPLEHTTGEITLQLWVQILRDTQQASAYIRNQMVCLAPAWMWSSSHPLSEQAERLKAFNCLHLLRQYVSATRNRRIDHFEGRLLDDVKYRGLPIASYETRWAAEELRRAEEARAGWQSNYRLIRQLASILDGAPGYHHGTLTRRIKQESGGAFKLLRGSCQAEAFTVEVRTHFEIGQGQKLTTPFILVNYCLALADEVEAAEPAFMPYLDACKRAYDRIKEIAEPYMQTLPAPAVRRPDDFAGVAA